jgi:parallel beta-helix repeat protein
MKTKTKKKIPVVIIFGIIFSFSLQSNFIINFTQIFSHKSSKYSDEINLDITNLKASKISGKIHIDNNWSAARDAGICTGNGTYSVPYIIKDLVIDGEGSGSCILIENSNVYFKIENCTVYNSGASSNDAGIKLSHVNNSQLIDNNCSTEGDGIGLRNCYNNTILGNVAIYNGDNGIIILGGDENFISGNIISHNGDNGISIFGTNNTISNNTIFDNIRNGIVLGGRKNMVSENAMVKCGLLLTSQEGLSSHNIDTTNLVNGKPLYYYVNKINLGSDNFTNAGQVILINCNESSISQIIITGMGLICGIVIITPSRETL